MDVLSSPKRGRGKLKEIEVEGLKTSSNNNKTSRVKEDGSPTLDHEQKRGKVILEIFETEQQYQRHLAEFIGVFLRNLESGDNEQARAFMSRPNLAGLCSNIEQISHLSQQLCGELRKALDNSTVFDDPSQTNCRAARTAIGPIFRRFASLLQLYEQYVENHAFAREDIHQFLDKPAFQLFWKKCSDDVRTARLEQQHQQQEEETSMVANMKSSKKADGTIGATPASSPASPLPPSSSSMSPNMTHTTSLDGYLILPIQRVPRYVLLLKELHRITERILQVDFGAVASSPTNSVHSTSNSPVNNRRSLEGGNSRQSSIKANNNASGSVDSSLSVHEKKLSARGRSATTTGGNQQQSQLKFYQDELNETLSAYKLVSDAALRMNEAIRGSESSQMMKELQSKFVGGGVELVGTGRMKDRRLIREGELMRVTQKSHRHRAFHFHLLTDMLLYSESLSGGGLKLHRSIPLDGTCKVFSHIQAPAGGQYESYGTTSDASSTGTGRRFSRQRKGSSGGGSSSAADDNRAFQVATHTKTITLYASNVSEKEAWVRDIKFAIRELAKTQNSSSPPSHSTLFSAEENSLECKICGAHFSLLKRKHNCKRCGVLTCADCCNRKRIFSTKAQRCCDVCRLEMDLTARDDQPNRFRVFAQIKSVTGLSKLARGDDRKDPLSRCYFALTQRPTKEGIGMRRGPTSVGHEASFMFPVGPSQDDSPYWVLRIFLLSVGEVGTITFDVRELMCARDMLFKRKILMTYPLKGPLVDEWCETAPTIAIAFELIMPPALWLTPELEHEINKVKAQEKSLNQSRQASNGTNMSSEEEEDDETFGFTVEERIKKFEGEEDEEDDDDMEGGSMNKTGNGYEFSSPEATPPRKHLKRPTGKLNVDVYTLYERIAKDKPSFWTVVCVKYLYIDTALRLADDDNVELRNLSNDALANLQERYLKFDHNPIIRKVWESVEGGDDTPTAPSLVRMSMQSPTNSTTKQDKFISQRARMFFDQVTEKRSFDGEDSFSGKLPCISPVINGELTHPRALVLQDLLRTEKAYVSALEVLDEVFITPLMQVAHGASAKSIKQGVQLSRGTGGPSSGQQQIQSTKSPSGVLGAFKQRKDTQESKAVAGAVKQPDVTVLLQSVRQILTINKQLLRDLESRLSVVDYSKCIGDIFSRFAVVLKVYNAYATNHLTVEKILTPRDIPLFSRRGSSSTPANNEKNPSPVVTNPHTDNPQEEDDGPSEALISFVKILEDDERCEGRSFIQLLRLPKERLNRYKRILTSLLMHTPDDHNDAELLRASLRLLDESEKHISWSVRRRANLEKLHEIQKSFIKVLPFSKTAPHLVSARRWFKKEGYLIKRCRRDDRLFKFWLFNDSLIYGEKVSKTSQLFRFCRFVMMKDMTVHDIPGGVDKRATTSDVIVYGDHRYAFEIRSPEKSFVVMVPLISYDDQQHRPSITKIDGSPSVSELASDASKKKVKDEWLREILQCIHDIHEEEESQTDNAEKLGETTDSLFKKTAFHNKKINEKAAPVWVHDDTSNTCSQCPNKFTITFRRHHCRSCGALVCDPCSKARVVLENIHAVHKQRVCKRCVAEMDAEN